MLTRPSMFLFKTPRAGPFPSSNVSDPIRSISFPLHRRPVLSDRHAELVLEPRRAVVLHAGNTPWKERWLMLLAMSDMQ